MAFSDIVPNLSISVDANCENLTITDTSTYGPCGDENANRDTVSCRSLLVRNMCGASVINVGGTAQSVCFAITGTVIAGLTYQITIDDCTFEYTVTAQTLVNTDEVEGCASFEVSGGTVGLTATASSITFLTGTVDFQIGTTSAITAKNLAIALDAAATAQGLGSVLGFDFSGNVVTVCASPVWYQAAYGADLNTQTFNFSVAGAGGTFTIDAVPVLFAGAILPTANINEQNIQNVLKGLYDQMVADGACETLYSVVLDYCETACQLRVTTLEPGFSFTYSSQIIGYAGYSEFSNSEIIANACTMELPVSDVDSLTIPYPGDGIYCFTIRLVNVEDDTDILEYTTCQALTCKLQCERNSALLSELTNCCDKVLCLPISTRLTNYIQSLENLTCQQDYELACKQLTAAQALVAQTGCTSCN